MATSAPPPFKSMTRPPATHFITGNIPAPTGLYVTDNDFLRIVSQTTLNSQPFTVSYRLIVADSGDISVGQTLFTPPSDGSVQVFNIPLTEGFLLGVSITSAAGASNPRGSCFISLQLGTGSTASPQAVQILCQDYISLNYGIAWPGGAIRNSLDPHGLITFFTAANPGAGADFSFAVTPAMRFKLLALTAQLTTSAAAGNRSPALRLRSGVTDIVRFGPNGVQAPSTSVFWTMTPGAAQPAVTGGVGGIIAPDEVWLSNANGPKTLLSSTSGLDAADVWTGIEIVAEIWIES